MFRKSIVSDHIEHYLSLTEMVSHSHGRYTFTQVQRCSQMSGPFKRELRRLFSLLDVSDRDNTSKQPKYREDIPEFIEEFSGEGLFEYCPPRFHSAFPNFKHSSEVSNPERLGEKLKGFSEKIDMFTDVK